jgi:hypothetical protein
MVEQLACKHGWNPQACPHCYICDQPMKDNTGPRPRKIEGTIYEIIPNSSDDCEMMTEQHRLRALGYDLILYDRDNYPAYRFIGENREELYQEILDYKMKDDEYPRNAYPTPKRKAEVLPPQPVDMINQPPHYTNKDGFPEVIDILQYFFRKEPLLWQVGKYIFRWDRKDTPLENLEKAEYYLKRKIEELKNER